MAKTNYRQDKSFWSTLLYPNVKQQFHDVIENAIDDIFVGDTSWVLEWVVDNFNPEDVYPEADLDTWATQHGYVKE